MFQTAPSTRRGWDEIKGGRAYNAVKYERMYTTNHSGGPDGHAYEIMDRSTLTYLSIRLLPDVIPPLIDSPSDITPLCDDLSRT